MKITYIGHSGFLVETGACYFIFDYYKGSLPLLQADKPVFVFASHAHHDHYEPKVFELLHEAGVRDVTAVLSEDISPKARPKDMEDQAELLSVFHSFGNLGSSMDTGVC